MTSRERVLAAINHKETGRVAVDLSGHRSSGMSAIVYPKLRAALGLERRPVYVYDPVQQLSIIDNDVLDRFGIDTIEMGRGFCLEDEWWADWTLPDGTPCKMPVWALPERDGAGWRLRSKQGPVLARMPEGALHFDQIHWPFFGVQEDLTKIPEALESSMWSVFGSPPGAAPLNDAERAAGAKQLRKSTNRAIIGLFGGNLLELGQMLYRMDEFLVMLAGEPARAHRFLDALVEMHLQNLETFLGTVGPYIDVILFGDDLGAQNCPQISPRMYKEFFQPRHKMMWARAKELADVKVMLHCCGAVRPLLPLLIEAGLDAINPVQISSRGMEAEGLKRDFGADLCFWGGGCDTQRLLPEGRPAEIREHVLRQCAVMAPGGGFVFQQVHNIMANVPAENVIAMFDAVAEFNAAGA
ncbi:MAG TPA: uroporphyrinogen decarboxylase family protein [Paludibaculum sp.]|jgi:uroporphyrinogen decarboxylase